MCLIGFGTTFFSYPITVSVQSCVTHENMAKMTSVIYTVYRVGGAVGAAVAGAIWTQTLYGDLNKKLGDSDWLSLFISNHTSLQKSTVGKPKKGRLPFKFT